MYAQKDIVEGLVCNPRVKSITFHPDGTLGHVEFFEPAKDAPQLPNPYNVPSWIVPHEPEPLDQPRPVKKSWTTDRTTCGCIKLGVDPDDPPRT
jgi:hypothetical protein